MSSVCLAEILASTDAAAGSVTLETANVVLDATGQTYQHKCAIAHLINDCNLVLRIA